MARPDKARRPFRRTPIKVQRLRAAWPNGTIVHLKGSRGLLRGTVRGVTPGGDIVVNFKGGTKQMRPSTIRRSS